MQAIVPHTITPTITNWKYASEVWRAFAQAHPELGYSGSANSWVHFQRRYGQRLMEIDVIRQPGGPRRGMIADTDRFEVVAFALLTTGALPAETTTAAAA
ncbi:hypothetical protein [Paraburkholderia saeva]|uniref:Uncharacterized protein n=1 Tax=Paraburkholderia saeva TaxID=2777537 RepID=A0A9N8RY85_9BURK|nr:hypothetical protein [Paraburkholderia saeva]CAG4905660.1 hypothetical protein LMG31841_03473 [Paraburkholderia saeva]